MTKKQGEFNMNAITNKAQAGQSKQLTPLEQVRVEFAQMLPKIKSALPPHIAPEKFLSVTMTALNLSPSLLSCDRQSLFNEALKCAADGLLPDGREAAFVPFKGKIKYMPMIGGIFKKVKNAGDIATLTSEVIYKNDKFRYWVNADGQQIEFEPLLFGERGEPIGVFAIAKTKDGAIEIETMTYEQIMDVKNSSAAKDAKESPWNTAFASEMWRKSVVRRLSKRLAMSTDVEKVIQADDDMYDFKQNRSKTKSEELSDRLNASGNSDDNGNGSTHQPENSNSFSPEFEAAVNESADPRMVK